MPELGELVRARRKELGLTQSQLGGSELTKGFLSLLEAGRTRPSAETLVLIARRLQMSPAHFLDHDTVLAAKVLRLCLARAWAQTRSGEYTGCAEGFKQALSIALRLQDRLSESECYIGLGYALASLRQFDLARQNVVRGKELAEGAGGIHQLVRVSHVLGVIAYNEHKLGEARDHFSEGYERYLASHHPDQSLGGALLFNIGNTYMELGDHVGAAHWYHQALPLLQSAEEVHSVGLVYLQLGVAERERGNYGAALQHLTRAQHLFEANQNRRFLGWAHNSIGITALAAGKLDDAIEHIEASLRIKETIGDDAGRARTLTELGRALTAKGAFDRAAAALDEAERLAKRFADGSEEARIHLARGRLYDLTGRTLEAIQWYESAIGSFERLQMFTDVGRACKALGDLLLKCERPSDAAPHLSRALDILCVASPSFRFAP